MVWLRRMRKNICKNCIIVICTSICRYPNRPMLNKTLIHLKGYSHIVQTISSHQHAHFSHMSIFMPRHIVLLCNAKGHLSPWPRSSCAHTLTHKPNAFSHITIHGYCPHWHTAEVTPVYSHIYVRYSYGSDRNWGGQLVVRIATPSSLTKTHRPNSYPFVYYMSATAIATTSIRIVALLCCQYCFGTEIVNFFWMEYWKLPKHRSHMNIKNLSWYRFFGAFCIDVVFCWLALSEPKWL